MAPCWLVGLVADGLSVADGDAGAGNAMVVKVKTIENNQRNRKTARQQNRRGVVYVSRLDALPLSRILHRSSAPYTVINAASFQPGKCSGDRRLSCEYSRA